MLNVAQIKNIISENNLCINKRLGQNFLIDKIKRDKIIQACDIKKDDAILEIGPGLGALTEFLISLCKKLVGVEKDRGLNSLLKQQLSESENLELIQGDILKFDLKPLYKKYRKKIKVIGNLPYYITSPIIFHLIDQKECIDSIFITLQKEVAERIVAAPGGKDYGVLSLSVQYHCKPKILFSIPKSAFFPMPKVGSAFLELKIRKEPAVKVKDEALLFNIVKSGFSQRRKTLINALSARSSLKISKEKLKEVFDKAGLDPNIRGEALNLEDFARLTQFLT
ncbi:MAG: 16S rRNA (adenine(1518)-N(6)/adenine(1519)-N(6))-dimethyltransferase RsmA [Candidatus Omnitrophica bacterium]|nr:16S rRNA (adenine(1518)-N(6)/adenine(1519)-N(6))-dimethyltransferase RsmA [Candidatus Omnitrophota bacterium]